MGGTKHRRWFTVFWMDAMGTEHQIGHYFVHSAEAAVQALFIEDPDMIHRKGAISAR